MLRGLEMSHAMSAIPSLSAGLLERYDRPGPRYTSYPTAPQLTGAFGEAQLREHIRRSNLTGADLSLYVHVPFCNSPCFYCGCNRIITRDPTRGERYLRYLFQEIEQVGPLFSRTREVVQLHLGGGTPNFLEPAQLARLLAQLGRQFSFSTGEQRDFSIELDPRFIGGPAVQALAELGFNRASLGVQDFDPAVQRAINRVQSIEQTLEVIQACRDSGMRSVNVDLIYGLPRQSLAGFGGTLDTIIAARPDRLAIYGYAHLPQLFKAQRRISEQELPDPKLRIELLCLAIERLDAAGYRYIGMDHFALPGDDLARAQDAGLLHRNFMGYTTHADCDLLGLGMSAISHIGSSLSQNPRELPAWESALEAGRLPVWRGLALSDDDVVRAEIIQGLMCQGSVDVAAIERRHGIDFVSSFSDALEELEALESDGLVRIGREHIVATDSGRLLLRVIAMCFDRYLKQPQPMRYSKVV